MNSDKAKPIPSTHWNTDLVSTFIAHGGVMQHQTLSSRLLVEVLGLHAIRNLWKRREEMIVGHEYHLPQGRLQRRSSRRIYLSETSRRQNLWIVLFIQVWKQFLHRKFSIYIEFYNDIFKIEWNNLLPERKGNVWDVTYFIVKYFDVGVLITREFCLHKGLSLVSYWSYWPPF